jgi:hypothetical protein
MQSRLGSIFHRFFCEISAAHQHQNRVDEERPLCLSTGPKPKIRKVWLER